MSNEPSELDLAYVAGFFDGEGSVAIRKSSPMTSNQNFRYNLLAVITNTNLPVLEHIQSLFGGVIKGRKWGPGMRRQGYDLYWSASSGRKVLELLLPYLRIKGGEAGLGIAFQEIVNMTTKTGNQYTNGLSQLDLDVREAFYQASKKLKHPVIAGEGEKDE